MRVFASLLAVGLVCLCLLTSATPANACDPAAAAALAAVGGGVTCPAGIAAQEVILVDGTRVHVPIVGLQRFLTLVPTARVVTFNSFARFSTFATVPAFFSPFVAVNAPFVRVAVAAPVPVVREHAVVRERVVRERVVAPRAPRVVVERERRVTRIR